MRRNVALRFVVLMGFVNLFADMTYEGSRGVVGAFLHHLGASATIVGIVAGGGELVGYGIRSVAGIIADRTGRYWIDAWVGYIINLLCVPALACAGSWPAAAGLVVGERLGRGIRRPAISAVVARAGDELGHGRTFGLNELLDQVGATVGPLLVALAIARTGSFNFGFAILIVPALIALTLLAPATQAGAQLTPANPDATGPALKDAPAFTRYAIGGALFAAGYVDFALISFQFQRNHVVSTAWISIVYALAMATGALAAPFFGRLLDRRGTGAVALALCVTALATGCAFLGHGIVAQIGAVLWGTGTAVQDALLLALVSSVITKAHGATTFGLYDLIFGVAWFAGSAIAGALLDRSLVGLVIFSVVLQLAAAPFFLFGRRHHNA